MAADIKLRIPDYTIQEEIARGGFGLVWRALHVPTQETVAIKVLHADLVGSHDIIMRFQREAETIAQLRHPNVVELYECGTLEDGRPYLVMEHLTGEDLDTHLAKNGPMDPSDVTRVLEGLTSALAAAHELGIVHRDLKASNVILSERDGAFRVVLLDFGIAKLLEKRGEPITAVQQAVGSPVCISPEQIRGDEVDSRTDIYGLGSLAFHMLTASPPFPGDWITAMDSHLFSERPRPSDRIDISPAFDDVILRAMSLEQSERHPSVRSFYADWCRAANTVSRDNGVVRVDATNQWVIGCYLDVHADASTVLGDPEPELLDDMASVFPMSTAYLEEHGFLLAYESGDSALFIRPCARTDGARRAQAVNDVLTLLPVLFARETRHPMVHVNLFLHMDEAHLSDGMVCGGPILDSTRWVVPYDAHAVLVSVELARDLELGPYAQKITDEVIDVYRLWPPREET